MFGYLFIIRFARMFVIFTENVFILTYRQFVVLVLIDNGLPCINTLMECNLHVASANDPVCLFH